ncbi:uncharacterized protein LOC105383898 isoform X1 [Plutella xylostella]|uniref:uncharacterized protein LOC105383898 isoform X1 n=1 Tax=Plutella xylostella TaxID=51655 RepID=UPI002032D34E|nr:uncharacterized protein LOC105383898 isoform X1 [Plutella xylostella]
MSNFIGNIGIFDCKMQDWKIFESRLQQFIKLNSVKDDSKCAVLLTHLNDESYRLARNLVYPRELEAVTYDELVKALSDHFTPRRSTFADRAKFYDATRGEYESAESWAARLRGLAINCEFGTELDTLLRDKFVLGMNVGAERDRLFEMDAKTLTLSKALEVAQQAASARQARAAMVKEEPVFRSSSTAAGSSGRRGGAARAGDAARAGGAASAVARDDGEPRCSICGLKNHNVYRCRYRNYRCEVCGVKGHLKKVCKNKGTRSGLHKLDTEPEASQESECDECKECAVFNLRYVSYQPIKLNVSVNGSLLSMELDSGSGTTVISDKLYYNHFSGFPLQKSNVKMCLYNGHKITPLGYFETTVLYSGISKLIRFFVVQNGGPPLLGRDFMAEFNVNFTVGNNNVTVEQQCIGEVPQLIDEYKELWSEGLGRFNKFKVDFKLIEGAEPKFFKPRPVPFALKPKVDEEINRLVGLGILVPVDFSRYGTPIIPVLKENGKVKIAGDFSVTLNKDIYVEKHPMPRIEDIFSTLRGGEHYTKIDLSNAFNQFELSEKSQELTTISTTKGLFKYTRMVYGLANAPAIFQKSMESLMAGLDGVTIWLDDICVTGPNKDTHLKRLREVFKRLRDSGLKLQKEKCAFFQKSVTYLGYVIDKHGIRPCPKKVEAIAKAPCPTNVSEVKRFLGVVNYYRSFVPQASSLLSPLHELLRDGAEWEWTHRHQNAFASMKEELTSERILAHWDPTAQLVLTVDASPTGLGGVLSQIASDGEERPLAYASRSLSTSEKNYSQIQKEATAIVFGVKKFHQYLYGRQEPFILKTDHRPLLSIFGKKNGISVMAASRLQRYAIFLSAYNYTVQFISSENNVVADFFSRAPIPEINSKCKSDVTAKDDDLSFLKFLDANIAPVSFREIKQAMERDKLLQTVIRYVNHGWPRKISCKSTLPYFQCKADLEVGNVSSPHATRTTYGSFWHSKM